MLFAVFGVTVGATVSIVIVMEVELTLVTKSIQLTYQVLAPFDNTELVIIVAVLLAVVALEPTFVPPT